MVFPVGLDALFRYPKLMTPLSIGTISLFFGLSKMSLHKHNTGAWWSFCCFGKRKGYKKIPTKSDDGSCSGSEEEGVSASSSRQERDENIEAQRQLQEQVEINKELQIQISDREDRIVQQTRDMEFMRTRLKEEEKEKQEVLTRLSEHISLKLADNNPNIADLSDLNRPTKLAEKFSLLYDDQWTDAFDALQQRPEFKEDSKAIKQLLDLLLTCFQFCREQADSQMGTMLSINNITVPSESVSTEMKKQMKETRKKCASMYIPVLHQIVIDLLSQNYEELIKAEKVQIFIKRCTELCWLMAVQDPPMALTGEVVKGAAYKKTEYREYTKSGPVVDYVVWPAVLIQDNGDLIAKGIVQCRDVEDAIVAESNSDAESQQEFLISKGDGEGIDYHNDLLGVSEDNIDKTDAVQEETHASVNLNSFDQSNDVNRDIMQQLPATEANPVIEYKTEDESDKYMLQESIFQGKGPDELIHNDSSLTAEETGRNLDDLSETKVITSINKDVTCEVKDIKTNTMIDSLNETEDNKYGSNESDPQENRQGERFDTDVQHKDTVSWYTDIAETKVVQGVNADASCEVKDAQDAVTASSQDKGSMISDGAGHNENILCHAGNCKISEIDTKEVKTNASEVMAGAETVRTPGTETVILEDSNAESVYSKDSFERSEPTL